MLPKKASIIEIKTNKNMNNELIEKNFEYFILNNEIKKKNTNTGSKVDNFFKNRKSWQVSNIIKTLRIMIKDRK